MGPHSAHNPSTYVRVAKPAKVAKTFDKVSRNCCLPLLDVDCLLDVITAHTLAGGDEPAMKAKEIRALFTEVRGN